VKRNSRGSRAAKTKPDKAGAARLRIEQAVRAIPRGKVSTYGGIARAAGVPGAARQVAAVLRRGFGLPWQRVLGAGGEVSCEETRRSSSGCAWRRKACASAVGGWT
jgi:alkylated DNA nucleotide flippase Atl1